MPKRLPKEEEDEASALFFLSEDPWTTQLVLPTKRAKEDQKGPSSDQTITGRRGFFQEPSPLTKRMGVWGHLPQWTVPRASALARLVALEQADQVAAPVTTLGLILDNGETKEGEVKAMMEHWLGKSGKWRILWAHTHSDAQNPKEAKRSKKTLALAASASAATPLPQVDWLVRIHKCSPGDNSSDEDDPTKDGQVLFKNLVASQLSIRWNTTPTILLLETGQADDIIYDKVRDNARHLNLLCHWHTSSDTAGRGKFPALVAPLSQDGIKWMTQMMTLAGLPTKHVVRAVQDACLSADFSSE
jgi:hypothetical protein